MFVVKMEAQGKTREEMIESVEDALSALKAGENEAGGYRLAEYSFQVTEE